MRRRSERHGQAPASGNLHDVSDTNDFAERLTTLEEQVAELRHNMRGAEVARTDAAAARILASGAYEEVGEMRAKLDAHTRTLNALRETQLEQGGRLTTLGGRLTALETEVRQGFSTLQAGMSQITALLTTLTRNTGNEDPETT